MIMGRKMRDEQTGGKNLHFHEHACEKSITQHFQPTVYNACPRELIGGNMSSKKAQVTREKNLFWQLIGYTMVNLNTQRERRGTCLEILGEPSWRVCNRKTVIF